MPKINIIFIFLFIALNSSAKDIIALIKPLEYALNSTPYKIKMMDKFENNISIFLPKNVKEPFNTFLVKSYKKLKKKIINTIESDCKETGNGYIKYHVNYATKDFISIKKTEGYMFCYAMDVAIPEYINLFVYNKKMYQVKLSNTATNKLNKVIWKDEDCALEAKNKTLFKGLIIKDRQPYIHMYLDMDKVCSQDKKINLNSKNFNFLPIADLEIPLYDLNKIIDYIYENFEFSNKKDKAIFKKNQEKWLDIVKTDCNLIYSDIGSRSSFVIYYNNCLKNQKQIRTQFLINNYVCKYSQMSGVKCEIPSKLKHEEAQ